MNEVAKLDGKLWVVDSNPKRGQTGGPLSTPVGNLFLNMLRGTGLKVSQIHFDYLVPRVPPAGHQKNGVEYFRQQGELEGEVELLKMRIRDAKPNLVIGLGADVLKELLGQTDLMKWRGHAVWCEEIGCKVLVTISPYHAHSQKRVGKADKPGQYWALMRADVQKALVEVTTPEMLHATPDLKVLTKYADAKQYLLDTLRDAKVVSYDIEVFKPYHGRLMDCIGLCYEWDRAVCIPFYIQEPDGKLARVFRNEEEYLEIMTLVKRVMESQIPKVAQNSSFDTTMLLKYYGIECNNVVWDTMVIQHSLYCDLPKDLGTLISLFTELPYHKYMIHSSSSMDRWIYNAADGVANLHVMQGQIKDILDLDGMPDYKMCKQGTIPKEFFKTEFAKHYYSLVNECIRTTVHMHIAGVRVDPVLREKVRTLEFGYIESIENALNIAIPERLHKNKKAFLNYNPRSPVQKKYLFNELLGCEPHEVRGKVTMDKKAMAKLVASPIPYVSLLADASARLKAADASLLKFKIEPDNGYIRTQYDVCGTDTGRLASRESDVMLAGTNLQNIEEGLQREMLIPEDGEELAHVDLYAAEAFLIYLDAGETEMLEYISAVNETPEGMLGDIRIIDAEVSDKYKVHGRMLEETQAKFPDECARAGYNYKKAKQTIHGLHYAVEPPMMSMESGLPINVTTWQYQTYHARYPGIKMRMARIVAQLKRTSTLTSPLGRRRFFMAPNGPDLNKVAFAWPSQSCIGEITIAAMNYVNTMGDLHDAGNEGIPFMRATLNTHDGLAIRTKLGERDLVTPWIVRAFNVALTIHQSTIRIPVSIGWGPTFNDNEDEKVYFYPLDI